LSLSLLPPPPPLRCPRKRPVAAANVEAVALFSSSALPLSSSSFPSPLPPPLLVDCWLLSVLPSLLLLDLIANAAPLPLPPLPPPPLLPPPLLPQPSYRRRAAAALPPHFPPPSRCHCAATIDHFRVGTKYHFAHVEPKIPKSSEKGSKRIKAQKLRNARQILDLAIPDKIWPRSQKPKKNKGRHPVRPMLTANQNFSLFFYHR
jgi:hypothetical protein